MAYNGSGSFNYVTAGQPVTTGTTISSSWANGVTGEISNALSSVLVRDGQAAMTGALNMGTNAISNVTTISASGTVTVGGINATAATVPANGLYLSAANTLAMSSNSTLRWSVNSTGNHVFAAPSSGNTFTAAGLSASNTVQLSSTGAGNICAIGWAAGIAAGAWNIYTGGTDPLIIGTQGNTTTQLATNSAVRLSVGGAGNITINAPSSGTTLALSAVATGISMTATDGTRAFVLGHSGGSVQFGSSSNHDVNILANNTTRVVVGSTGNVTINAPSSGNALTVTQFSSTAGIRVNNGSGSAVWESSGTNTTFGTDGAWGLVLQTNNTARLTITSAGAATFSGAVTHSSTTTMTGAATAPTPSVGDSTTNVATTAFVDPARSHGANGYQKLSSGLIIQWGSASVTSGSSTAVTFPIAFGTAVYSITLGASSASTANKFMSASVAQGTESTTGFTINNNNGDTGTQYWMAIGK